MLDTAFRSHLSFLLEMALTSLLFAAVLGGRYDGILNMEKFRGVAQMPDPAMEHSLKLAARLPGCVFDVGANGGQQSYASLKRGRETYAFECLASAYDSISKAISANVFPNVDKYTLIHGCAGSSSRFGKLHLAFDSSSLLAENVARGYESRKANWSSLREGHFKTSSCSRDLLFSPDKKVAAQIDTQGNEYDVRRVHTTRSS